jgi:hypothetical protein
MVKLIYTRFFLIWFKLTVAFTLSKCNVVLRLTAKFMRFNSPTSKPIFLSSLLRVNGATEVLGHGGCRFLVQMVVASA